MHLAGYKLRRWRETHQPPLSAAQFGARYGQPKPWPSRTVYGWEAKGKIASGELTVHDYTSDDSCPDLNF